MSYETSMIKLRLDCSHLIETRVYYDPTTTSKHDRWVGRLSYCPQCRKIRKIRRVEKGSRK